MELESSTDIVMPPDPIGEVAVAEPIESGQPEAKVPAPSTPTISSFDYDEISKRSFEATQRALEQARLAEVQAQPVVSRPDPSSLAIDAVDLRNDLYEEATEQYEDMPKEVKTEVRQLLRGFRTLDALRTAKASGLHKILADAAYGKAVREGKHTPAKYAPSVNREPVHSEPSAKIPAEFRREQEEVCRLLGVTLSEAELQAAWRSR